MDQDKDMVKVSTEDMDQVEEQIGEHKEETTTDKDHIKDSEEDRNIIEDLEEDKSHLEVLAGGDLVRHMSPKRRTRPLEDHLARSHPEEDLLEVKRP